MRARHARTISLTGVLCTGLAGCVAAPAVGLAPVPAMELSDAALTPPTGWATARRQLLAGPATPLAFADEGPLDFREAVDFRLQLPTGERLLVDLEAPASDSPTPLVILVHGNLATKEAHRDQARRLASYGMATLTVQLPNHDRWLENGRTLARLTRYLRAKPAAIPLFAPRIDTGRIVLVGHSFGGSAVAVAAGQGAVACGLVLLDPALLDVHVQPFLPRITRPVMLLGADPNVFRAREQATFFKMVGAEMAEIQVAGATHDDAQAPSMFALAAFGFDPFTSPTHRASFTAALALSAFSLAATGGLDYAFNALTSLAGGVYQEPRRRAALAL